MVAGLNDSAGKLLRNNCSTRFGVDKIIGSFPMTRYVRLSFNWLVGRLVGKSIAVGRPIMVS